MFWTTQGWSNGTVIRVSPSANQLLFQQDFAVVDDVFIVVFAVVGGDFVAVSFICCNCFILFRLF